MNNIKISACIITYNHERFIAEAIEGALLQKINCPYEIVIGEDCSTDKTRDIIIDYQKKYPEKIRVILNNKNLGMMGNWINTINSCKGEYIALCEGDDYWTDPYKLQKQIDFLDKNSDYSISSHGTNVKWHDNMKPIAEGWHFKKRKDIITLEDLLENGSGGSTCSLVFRNKIFGEFPEWYGKQKGGDYTIQVLCASKGKMKDFSEKMGVYRRHKGGAKAAIVKESIKNNIDPTGSIHTHMFEIIDTLDKHFNYKYSHLLGNLRGYANMGMFRAYFSKGDIDTCKKYAHKLLPSLTHVSFKEFLKIIMILILPKFILKKYFAIKYKNNKN